MNKRNTGNPQCNRFTWRAVSHRVLLRQVHSIQACWPACLPEWLDCLHTETSPCPSKKKLIKIMKIIRTATCTQEIESFSKQSWILEAGCCWAKATLNNKQDTTKNFIFNIIFCLFFHDEKYFLNKTWKFRWNSQKLNNCKTLRLY